jgi:hypothetical protein
MTQQQEQQQERAALETLIHNVKRAAEAGDEQAAEVKASTPLALLRNLARWFSNRYLELRG